jgi:hypothetical protein
MIKTTLIVVSSNLLFQIFTLVEKKMIALYILTILCSNIWILHKHTISILYDLQNCLII